MSAYLAAGRVSGIGPVEVHGGLMLSWQLDGATAVVVGGGPVAAQRARLVRAAGAAVKVISPRLNAELSARVARGEYAATLREVEEADVEGAALVMSAVDDAQVTRQVAAWCRERRIPVNCADVPPLCDFYLPAVHRDGPIQIAVGTQGEGPGMSARIRDLLADALPVGAGEAVRRFGALRRAVRAHDPAPESQSRRMDFLRPIGATWPLESLRGLDIDAVIRRYPESLERPAESAEPIGAPCAPRRGAGGWWSHLGAGVTAGVRARAAASGGRVGSVNAEVPASAAALTVSTPSVADRSTGSSPDEAQAPRAATAPSTAGELDGAASRASTSSPPASPSAAEAAPAGVVTLVGAGPGDPDLLTLGAARAIAEADLVLCDRLVPPAIRALARGEVRVANKEPGLADAVQHELDDAAIAAARAGRRVVRLKIGDPGVFGRLGEELDSYAAAEVPSRVVPGVSSALAGPALAGVPLTLRGVADQIVIGTGHAAGDADVDAPAWRPGTTWVFLMAVRRLDALASGCVAAGFPADLPAALIQDASTPGQRVVDSTLATLAEDARRHGVRAPAVLVLGEVAALRHRAVEAAPLRATG